MRKTHYRDYATAAFALLAKEGSSAAYKERIYNEAMERERERTETRGSGISAPTEAAVMRAEQAIYDAQATLSDLEAAEWALAALERMRGRHAVLAVRGVYMLTPGKEPARGEVTERVAALSVNMPADPSCIYRWLALARDLFAEKRGLRM